MCYSAFQDLMSFYSGKLILVIIAPFFCNLMLKQICSLNFSVLVHSVIMVVYSFSRVGLTTKEWVNVTLQISLLYELSVQMFLCFTLTGLYRGKGLWLWFPLQD